ncbi:MAG: hypothetical protein O2954_16930, partial [bacterium]|nr:hypothetical protein [bacterium]
PIVSPTYRPGAPTRLHEISGTDALTRLIGLTTNRQRIDHLPATLGKLVESTTCFALTAGSLEPALDVLESIFQRTVPDANRHARTGSASNTPPG